MPQISTSDNAVSSAQTQSFAKLAELKADEIRDCVNTAQLAAWLEEIANARLGGEPSERKQKARAWLMGVGRKSVIRKGAASAFSPKGGETVPEWAKKALSEGKPLLRLTLPRSEANELGAICDWLKSEQGPPTGSDWSRVSRPQAKQAERLWLKELAKRAKKERDESEDAKGTELFAKIEGEGWEGWRWVRVKSEAALSREGELMGHCVGSYAEEVEEGLMEVYSLRDPSNKPKLTVEADNEGCLEQLKAFANAEAGPEWAQPAAAFLRAYGAFLGKKTPKRGQKLIPSLSEDWDRCGAFVTPWGFVGSALEQSPEEAKAARAWGKKNPGDADAELGYAASMGNFALAKAILAAEPSPRGVALALGQALDSDVAGAPLSAWADILLEKAEPASLPWAVMSLANRNGLSKEDEAASIRVIDAAAPEAEWGEAIASAARYGYPKMMAAALARAESVSKEKLDSILVAAAGSSGKCLDLAWAARERLGAGEPSEKTRREALEAGLLNSLEDKALERFYPKRKLPPHSRALGWALDRGRLAAAAAIMPFAPPKALDEGLLQSARLDRPAHIALLAPRVSKEQLAGALMSAVKYENAKAVKELLKWVDVKTSAQQALSRAAEGDSVAIIKALLPLSNPAAGNYEALMRACNGGGESAVAMELVKACPCPKAKAKALALAIASGRPALSRELAKGLSPSAREIAMTKALRSGWSSVSRSAAEVWELNQKEGRPTSQALIMAALDGGAHAFIEKAISSLDETASKERLLRKAVETRSPESLKALLASGIFGLVEAQKAQAAAIKEEWRFGEQTLRSWREIRREAEADEALGAVEAKPAAGGGKPKAVAKRSGQG